MKKKLLILPLLTFGIISSLVGCATDEEQAYEKFRLTYGTYATNTSVELKYGDLETHLEDKESMFVVTYQGDDSHCSCWSYLDAAMDVVISKHHYLLYKINVNEFDGEDKLGFTLKEDRPTIHFVKNGQVLKDQTIKYTTDNTHDAFLSSEGLYQLLIEKTYKPNMYYINPNQKEELPSIDEHINSNEEFVVCYTKTKCPDCKYIFPKILTPFNNKEFNKPFYIVDLEGMPKETYQAYKDSHHLSDVNDSKFGYDTGYVPTLHYYKNGQIQDACVGFNDTVSKVGEQYKVTNTYYTKERQKNLSFIKDVKTPVLLDLVVPVNEVQIFEEYNIIRWDNKFAAKYHQPIVEAFMNAYLI